MKFFSLLLNLIATALSELQVKEMNESLMENGWKIIMEINFNINYEWTMKLFSYKYSKLYEPILLLLH